MATLICLGQTATEYDSPSVNNIAAKLNCSCGCKLRMDCQMQPGCGTCKAAKLKILELQKQGRSEGQILDQFVGENGADIIATPPGNFGAAASYSALAVGLGVVLFAIRRYLKPATAATDGPAAPVDDRLLSKYQAEIDKDLEKLD
jgi:cytochrome c-type biogenesis protein CcmH/NrfF